MTLNGSRAIEWLAQAATSVDIGASSHWRQEHADFRFTGHGFEGLRGGFGGATPRHPHRRLGHWLFQRPFRTMATGWSAFAGIDALAHRVCKAQKRNCDLHVLRQTMTLAFLQSQVPERLTAASTVCVIGDGFGTMTALLAGASAAGRIVLVNLTRTLLVDLWYLRLWLGETAFDRRVVLVQGPDGLAAVLDRPVEPGTATVVAIQAQDHALLRACPIDLTLNIASMGEMDPPTIADYFADLRAAALHRPLGHAFYCCNRDEKRLPDGTVTRFADYPWRADDRILVDGPCPWHQRHYTARPPFYHPYDGLVRHRLAILASSACHS